MPFFDERNVCAIHGRSPFVAVPALGVLDLPGKMAGRRTLTIALSIGASDRKQIEPVIYIMLTSYSLPISSRNSGHNTSKSLIGNACFSCLQLSI